MTRITRQLCSYHGYHRYTATRTATTTTTTTTATTAAAAPATSIYYDDDCYYYTSKTPNAGLYTHVVDSDLHCGIGGDSQSVGTM